MTAAPVLATPAVGPVDEGRLVEVTARWLRSLRHWDGKPCNVCARDAVDLVGQLRPVLSSQSVDRSTGGAR